MKSIFFILILIFSILFLIIICSPSISFKDSGELLSSSYVLGVSHPTGFAFFNLLSKTFSFLPFGSIFFRINLLSVISSSLIILLSSIFVFRLFKNYLSKTILFCTSFSPLLSQIYLLHSTNTEVYAISGFFLVIFLNLLLIYHEKNDIRILYIISFLLGVGCGVHITFPLYGSITLFFYFILNKKFKPPFQKLFLSLAFFIFGGLIILYFYFSSLREPPRNWGSPDNIERLISHLTGKRIRESFEGVVASKNLSLFFTHLISAMKLYSSQIFPIIPIGLVAIIAGIFKRLKFEILLSLILLFDLIFSAWINPMGMYEFQTGVPFIISFSILFSTGSQMIYNYLKKISSSLKNISIFIFPLIVVSGILFSEGVKKIKPSFSAHQIGEEVLLNAEADSLIFTNSDDMCSIITGLQIVEGYRPDIFHIVLPHITDKFYIQTFKKWSGDEIFTQKFYKWIENEKRKYSVDEVRSILAELINKNRGRNIYWEMGERFLDPVVFSYLEAGFPLFKFNFEKKNEIFDIKTILKKIDSNLNNPSFETKTYISEYLDELSIFLAFKNEKDTSIEILNLANKISPENVKAKYNYAVLLFAKGEKQKAIELLKEVIKERPDYLKARTTIVKYLREMTMFDEAELEEKNLIKLKE